jgi:hypothetical protein
MSVKGSTIKALVKNPISLMNEGPTAIGMMSVIINAGGSLDTAVRDIAKNGPVNIRKIFRSVVYDADIRETPDIKTGLISALSSLSASSSVLRRSIHLVIAASESNDKNERARILKDASDLAISGLKEAGETYSSSLNTPCMMVFGLGIMVPMILMSILPMLSMGGIFGGSVIDPTLVTLVTLLGIPSIVVVVIISIKDRNPFVSADLDHIKVQDVWPLFTVLPILVIAVECGVDIGLSAVIAFSVAGLMMFVSTYGDNRKEVKRYRQEAHLKDSIFELGNRLISGDNYENALISAIGTRNECSEISESLKREMILCRGDNCSAIRMSVGRISMSMSDILCDISACAQKNIRDAGRLAISVGRQIQDQEVVRKGINNKLKSMVDMMTGTAVFFAPLVLGMSLSMMMPISEMVGGDLTDTRSILLVYVVELCVLMSFLTAYLSGNTGRKQIIWRISMMVPISLIVFHISSMISF